MLPTATKKTAVRSGRQHWALLPFVAGVTIGLAVSTLFLVRPSPNSITNVYISLPSVEEDDPRLADFRRMVEQLQPRRVEDGVSRLEEEVTTRGPVYYAVVMADRHSAEQLQVLRSTWARDVPHERLNFFIPAESHDTNSEDYDSHYGEISEARQVVELANPALMELQALQFVCRHRLNNTKWFFLSHDDVYVKTHALEEHLQQLENAQAYFGYLGKPVRRDPIGRVCMPGPGVVLSLPTLTRLCPSIDACISTQTESSDSDTVVGECIRGQLPDVQCIKEGQPHDLFLKYDAAKKGALVSPTNKHFLERALTVYPITDTKLMYNIHLFSIGSILNDSQHELHRLKLAVDRMSDLLPQSDPDRKEPTGLSSKDDISAWKLINSNLLMSDEENSPAIKTPPVWRKEMELLMQKAMDYLNSWEENHYSFKRITNAYWKVEPASGVEYIIDFQVKPEGQEDDYYAPAKQYRVTLSRFFNPPEVSPVKFLPSSPEIHVSVAVFLTSDQLTKFQDFMERFRDILEQDKEASLFVVQMKSPEKVTKKSKIIDTKSILSLYETNYPKASFKVLESRNLLSREHGISLVLHELKPSQVVFLADLDLDFDVEFMQRCRNFPIQGQQAFFPIMFAEADPSLLEALNNTHLESNAVSQHSGYWLLHSHSAACIYAADVLATAQDSSLKGIPNEIDMKEVYRRLISKGYEIIRSTDSGLRRRYAPRECDTVLVGESQEPCMQEGGFYSSLYTRTELSVLLFDHEGENSDIKF